MKLFSNSHWWASSLLLMLASGIILITGCALRYVEKTPLTALQYPHFTVSPQELKNYKALVAINPKDPQAAQARFWIAQDAFNRSHWELAEKEFNAVGKKHPQSEWAPVALVMAARAQVEQKKPLVALAGLQRLLQRFPEQPELQPAVNTLAQNLINDVLSLAELAQIRTSYPNTEWDQLAAFVIGKRNLDLGNADAAITAFQAFLALYPQSVYAPWAKELIDKAGALVPVNRNRIGCLLPVTGMYAPYGVAIRQGLELALNDINRERPEGEHLGLVVADTQSTTAGVMAGLRRLAGEEKVIAIIGPVLSSSVRAILPELDRWRIPIISPSAGEPGLTSASAYFYRYMLTNQQQGEAMAEYVVLRKNLLRVGILNGEEPYDRSLAEAFANKIQQLGGEIIARVEYPIGVTDFKPQMLALGGVDPGIMKEQESTERKALERFLENMAFDIAERIAPQAQKMVEDKSQINSIPEKRVAIIRFAEEALEGLQEELGKGVTEKFSYILAVKPGLKVLTQDETFKGLKKTGYSPLNLDLTMLQTLGQELAVDYMVLGSIKATGQIPRANPGTPISVPCQIEIRLMKASSGELLKTYTTAWEKNIAAEGNLKEIEAIYLPVSAKDAILISAQLDFYDFKVAVFGSDAWLNGKLLREGSEILDQAVLATGFWPEDQSPRTQDFVKQFETRFSQAPSLLSAQAYDILSLVAGALKNFPVNSRREEFPRYLLQQKNIEGVTGKATVGLDQEIRREPIFLEISQGKFKRVR